MNAATPTISDRIMNMVVFFRLDGSEEVGILPGPVAYHVPRRQIPHQLMSDLRREILLSSLMRIPETAAFI